jgi:hypothetical protein
MKSAGSRLVELGETGGTCIDEVDCSNAEERALEKRLEQKQEAMAAEAAKAAQRAAKMAAKRAKAKHVQMRHELQIAQAEAKKSALETQAEHDKEVLGDIVAMRRAAQRKIAEQEAQDDSLECVLRWALPEASTKSEGEQGADDEAVLRLMAKSKEANDDARVVKLMDKELVKLSSGETVSKLTGKEAANDNATVMNLMTDDTRNDNATVMKLMTDDDRANGILDGSRRALKLRGKDAGLENTINPLDIRKFIARTLDNNKNSVTKAKDDEAFRLILDSAANQDEARINADALRFILGGAQDPVTRLAHLARSRPTAGRSRAEAAAAQAVHDLQVLNHLLEKTDLDIETQAWKDVGAIHMLMHDLPGPDPAKRKRANELTEADNEAMQALMNPSISLPKSGAQDASDVTAVQRLLGQSTQANALQPPNFAPGSPLHRLMVERPAHPQADMTIVQELMSPRGQNSLRLGQAHHARLAGIANGDMNIVQQLMSPPSNTVQQLASASKMASSPAPAPTPTVGLMGVLNRNIPSSLREQDISVARSLMDNRPVISEAQTLRDVDTLRMLIQ